MRIYANRHYVNQSYTGSPIYGAISNNALRIAVIGFKNDRTQNVQQIPAGHFVFGLPPEY